MKRTIAAAGLGLLLVLGACGADSESAQVVPAGTDSGDETGTAAGGTRPSASPDADNPANLDEQGIDPDTPVSNPAQAGPADEPEPMLVEPRSGMDNLRPVHWESAERISERVVRVRFYGGVEPCDVLDSVEVAYGKKAVTLSLFAGSDPAQPNAVCIEIAQLKTVDVQLTEDLDGRKIRDGSPAQP